MGPRPLPSECTRRETPLSAPSWSPAETCRWSSVSGLSVRTFHRVFHSCSILSVGLVVPSPRTVCDLQGSQTLPGTSCLTIITTLNYDRHVWQPSDSRCIVEKSVIVEKVSFVENHLIREKNNTSLLRWCKACRRGNRYNVLRLHFRYFSRWCAYLAYQTLAWPWCLWVAHTQ